MAAHTQVAKWGNSLAVRLPRAIAQEAGLAEGDQVSLDVGAGRSIVLRSARRKYTLRELVSQITPANRCGETSWGAPKGRESW
jgi:antitoxin MazE